MSEEQIRELIAWALRKAAQEATSNSRWNLAAEDLQFAADLVEAGFGPNNK